MEIGGLGRLSPNMMLIGFQESWSSNSTALCQYMKVLLSAFDLQLSVGIFRLKVTVWNFFGLILVIGFIWIIRVDFDFLFLLFKDKIQEDQVIFFNYQIWCSIIVWLNLDWFLEYGSVESFDSGISKSPLIQSQTSQVRESKSLKKSISVILKMSNSPDETDNQNEEEIEKLAQFKGKEPVAGEYIDVYWLFDDGGLTLLIPFILKMRKKYSKCKLRIFFLANNLNNIEEETRNMTALLKKFRIDFSDVTVLADVQKKPRKDTSKSFESLVSWYLKYIWTKTWIKTNFFVIRFPSTWWMILYPDFPRIMMESTYLRQVWLKIEKKLTFI